VAEVFSSYSPRGSRKSEKKGRGTVEGLMEKKKERRRELTN
jgi:hypothetical protein